MSAERRSGATQPKPHEPRAGLLRRALYSAYWALPHTALGRVAGRVATATRPRPLVQAALRAWTRIERIELDDFEPGPYASVHELFLRRLRPGRRPIREGVVSPVDGRVIATGQVRVGRVVTIKGLPLTLERVVNGRSHDLSLAPFEGGVFVVLFLSPRGYHRIHAPVAGTLRDVRWIPGRYYPQNEKALALISRVYEQNERATLRLATADGEVLLVMVAASLVGGIHVAGLSRPDFTRTAPRAIDRAVARGDELGHFAFGSTVVLLFPPSLGAGLVVHEGDDVRMGETLIAPPGIGQGAGGDSR